MVAFVRMAFCQLHPFVGKKYLAIITHALSYCQIGLLWCTLCGVAFEDLETLAGSKYSCEAVYGDE